jgi:hypothetical protein
MDALNLLQTHTQISSLPAVPMEDASSHLASPPAVNATHVGEAFFEQARQLLVKWWGQDFAEMMSMTADVMKAERGERTGKEGGGAGTRESTPPVVAEPMIPSGVKVQQDSPEERSNMPPLAALVAATITMLTCGGDDVIWLLPFFSSRNKWTKTAWYLLFMEVVVVGSWLLKEGMVAAETHYPNQPVRKIIQAISSILLTCLCGYLFFEWWYEDDGDVRSDGPESSCGGSLGGSLRTPRGGTDSPAIDTSAEQPQSSSLDSHDTSADRRGGLTEEEWAQRLDSRYHKVDHSRLTVRDQIHNQHHDTHGVWLLFVVSMVGSCDNFAVFSYIMYANILNVWQMATGVFIGSCMIATVAHGVCTRFE